MNEYKGNTLEITYFVRFAWSEVGRVDDELGGIVIVVCDDFNLPDLLNEVLIASIDMSIAVVGLYDDWDVHYIWTTYYVPIELTPHNISMHRMFKDDILIDSYHLFIVSL
jgi:hypothetical protein